jgi:hypothetical protein
MTSMFTFPRVLIPGRQRNTYYYIADVIRLITQFQILYCIFDTPNDLK